MCSVKCPLVEKQTTSLFCHQTSSLKIEIDLEPNPVGADSLSDEMAGVMLQLTGFVGSANK